MARKHSHHGMTVRLERRAARLEVRADIAARRSARQYGVVVSLAQMAELRHAITKGPLPDTSAMLAEPGHRSMPMSSTSTASIWSRSTIAAAS